MLTAQVEDFHLTNWNETPQKLHLHRLNDKIKTQADQNHCASASEVHILLFNYSEQQRY